MIFDMDDLMTNTHQVCLGVMEEILQRHGASLYNPDNPLRPEEELGMFGRKTRENLDYLFQKYGLGDEAPQADYDWFTERVNTAFGEGVEEMPGLRHILQVCREQSYRTAIASSSTYAKIDIVLEKIGLAGEFEVIVSSADEDIRGKPDPDVFLMAAERLGIKPENCVVLEDAKVGVEAAKKGGMYCIGVHNSHLYQKLGYRQDLSAADLEVGSLAEINEGNIPGN